MIGDEIAALERIGRLTRRPEVKVDVDWQEKAVEEMEELARDCVKHTGELLDKGISFNRENGLTTVTGKGFCLVLREEDRPWKIGEKFTVGRQMLLLRGGLNDPGYAITAVQRLKELRGELGLEKEGGQAG